MTRPPAETGACFKLSRKLIRSENSAGESRSAIPFGMIETSPTRRSVMSSFGNSRDLGVGIGQLEPIAGLAADDSRQDLAVSRGDDCRLVAGRDPAGGLQDRSDQFVPVVFQGQAGQIRPDVRITAPTRRMTADTADTLGIEEDLLTTTRISVVLERDAAEVIDLGDQPFEPRSRSSLPGSSRTGHRNPSGRFLVG